MEKKIAPEDLIQAVQEKDGADFPEHLKQTKKGDSFQTGYEGLPVGEIGQKAKPGRQSHLTGREGVPQLGSGIPRLRDEVDLNDPSTQPGPLKVTNIPQNNDNK